MEEPETRSLLSSAAVGVAMASEQLVERVGRIDDDAHSRRLAIGARRVERFAAALVEELSRVETSTGQRGHKRAP